MRRISITTRVCTAGSLALALACASCVSGPDYQRPQLNARVPQARVSDGYKSATAQEAAQPGLGQDWWKVFQDPDLNALVEEALDANQNLKAAMARVAQARASAASVKSSFFPVVTLDPSETRSRRPVSITSSNPTASTTTGSSQTSTTSTEIETKTVGSTGTSVQIPFDLSYEIDIWGRVRRSYEAAQAETQASVCELEVVRQTLLAELLQSPFVRCPT